MTFLHHDRCYMQLLTNGSERIAVTTIVGDSFDCEFPITGNADVDARIRHQLPYVAACPCGRLYYLSLGTSDKGRVCVVGNPVILRSHS